MPVHDKPIYNPEHHEHALSLRKLNSRYTCDGCKEPGIHSGYCCDRRECNFVLHQQCTGKIGHHYSSNRFINCDFVFAKWIRLSVFAGYIGTTMFQVARCEVCVKPINGYAYTAATQGGGSINLHPPCATLPPSIGHMKLVYNITTNCLWCNYQILPGLANSWAYISTTSHEQIHVGCVKDMLFQYSNGGSIFGGNLQQGMSYLALPSSSSTSTAIVPIKHGGIKKNDTATSHAIVPRKRDRIKNHAKAIGHAVAAVLGPVTTIASLGAAIATLIPFL